MCEVIPCGNFNATRGESGQWIYKAKDSTGLAKKVNPKYREEPQFGLQTQIEGNAEAGFKLNLNKTIIQILKLIK